MKLPYRYRGIALLTLLAVALPWGVWHFALHDTIRTWRDCRRLAARLETLAPETGQSGTVTVDAEELILSGGLLDTVRRAAEDRCVRITGYEPCATRREEGAAVHTAQLTLTGGYADLLRVVDALERRLPGCRLRSLDWRTATDRRTHRKQLVLTLYVQQIVLTRSCHEKTVTAAARTARCGL